MRTRAAASNKTVVTTPYSTVYHSISWWSLETPAQTHGHDERVPELVPWMAVITILMNDLSINTDNNHSMMMMMMM